MNIAAVVVVQHPLRVFLSLSPYFQTHPLGEYASETPPGPNFWPCSYVTSVIFRRCLQCWHGTMWFPTPYLPTPNLQPGPVGLPPSWMAHQLQPPPHQPGFIDLGDDSPQFQMHTTSNTPRPQPVIPSDQRTVRPVRSDPAFNNIHHGHIAHRGREASH
jgi:hypothetical protein